MKNILLSLTLFVASCACFQPEHRNDPQCAIINQVVDCTEGIVKTLGPQFIPVIKQLIADATGQDGAIDWTKVETILASMGVKDGGCILAAIDLDYLQTSSPTASMIDMNMHKSYHEHFTAYRAKKWPGVKFKFIDAQGKVVLQ